MRLIVLLALLIAGTAHAENVLEDIAYTALPGGKVEVTLKFSAPVQAPQIFTTESPPRIAIDLADTRNGMAQKRIEVGAGATAGISAIEAAGRTRVVIDLFRPASYEKNESGNTLVLTVNSGVNGTTAAAVSAAATDPTKAVPVQGLSVRPASRSRPARRRCRSRSCRSCRRHSRACRARPPHSDRGSFAAPATDAAHTAS